MVFDLEDSFESVGMARHPCYLVRLEVACTQATCYIVGLKRGLPSTRVDKAITEAGLVASSYQLVGDAVEI